MTGWKRHDSGVNWECRHPVLPTHMPSGSNQSVDPYGIILHTAGLSRPMNIHETNISKSIDLNIIGTANLVKICKNLLICILRCKKMANLISCYFSETNNKLNI